MGGPSIRSLRGTNQSQFLFGDVATRYVSHLAHKFQDVILFCVDHRSLFLKKRDNLL